MLKSLGLSETTFLAVIAVIIPLLSELIECAYKAYLITRTNTYETYKHNRESLEHAISALASYTNNSIGFSEFSKSIFESLPYMSDKSKNACILIFTKANSNDPVTDKFIADTMLLISNDIKQLKEK